MDYLDPKIWNPVKQVCALAAQLVESAVRKEGASVILPLLSRFSTKRDLLRVQLQALSDAVRDLILLKKSDDAPLSFYPDREHAIDLCDRAALPFLYEWSDAIRKALDENARNANVRLCLTKMALSARIL